MAERASLMRKNGIVNQAAAISLILFLASCGGKEEPTRVKASSDAVSAPIIWQTGALKENLSALSTANDGSSRFLMGFESGGLQMVSFDGADVSEPGPYKTESLGSGTMADFQGAQLAVFPGVSRNADKIVVYVYGEGLVAPFEVELAADIEGAIEGVCSASADYDAATAIIAYWTDLDNSTLVRGRIRVDGENLIYEKIDELSFSKYLTSCDLEGSYVVAGGGFGLDIRDAENKSTLVSLPDVPVDISALETDSNLQIATALSGGRVFVADASGNASRIAFEEGLSSQAPEKVAHVLLSDATSEASFPNGFLAVESRIIGQDTQLVFVDRQDLYRSFKAD